MDYYLSFEEKDLKLAWLIKDIITYYLNSSLIQIDRVLLEKYLLNVNLSIELIELIGKKNLLILSKIKEILGDMKNRKLSAPHDFYLKMYQFMKPKLNYDTILIDEAQDISPVMMSIINSQSAKKIYVGDTFQQIYSFRFAINSLELLNFPTYKLTKSFRFGKELAQEIEVDINKMYEILLNKKINFKIDGNEKFTQISRTKIDFNNKTIIARSNLKLFESVIKYLNLKNIKLYFEGEYHSYGFMNSKIFNLIHLYKNDFHKINDEFIKRFKSFAEFTNFAEETKNRELLLYIKLVKEYTSELFDINKLIKERLITKEKSDIIFTTTHKAKGNEYKSVEMLNDDFITIDELNKSKNEIYKLREEINIYYVASTRAKEKLKLPYI